MFFSPVLHCIPDSFPYVIVRFIIHNIQTKNFVKIWCKECHDHYKSLLNRKIEYCPYASTEFWFWILQGVAIDTEGTGRYDVSGESGHRLLHLYCGTWQQSVLLELPRFTFTNSEVSTNSYSVAFIQTFSAPQITENPIASSCWCHWFARKAASTLVGLFFFLLTDFTLCFTLH